MVVKAHRARSRTQKEEEKSNTTSPNFVQKTLLLNAAQLIEPNHKNHRHSNMIVNQFSFNQSHFRLNQTIGDPPSDYENTSEDHLPKTSYHNHRSTEFGNKPVTKKRVEEDEAAK